MDYKVFVTSEAEEDLNRYVQYLLFEKKKVDCIIKLNFFKTK